MTTFNNQTGYYHFRCWRGGDGKIVGEALSLFEYQAYIHDGWHIVSFPGRRGTVCILIEDMTVTRLDCLQFAISFMEGKMLNYAIDLDRCTTTKTAIIPPP